MARILAAILGIALATAAAKADVYFGPPLGLQNSLSDTTGAPITDGTWVLVLDRDNNGMAGQPYTQQSTNTITASNWLWDAGDYILGRGKVEDGMAFPDITITVTNGNPSSVISGYTAGVDQVYVMWFDQPYSAAAQGPGADVKYGVEFLDFAPGDAGALTTIAVGGNVSLNTVPEPATMGLLALALGGIVVRRRNRRA